MMSWILFTLVGLLIVHQVKPSGVFELRVISFDNQAGKDDLGKCCTGKIKPNLECDGVCRPTFRVCLKEYQTKIDATSPCTFGDVFTSELGPNPVSDTPQNGFANSIAIQFTFTWPQIFSLTIEAWHWNQISNSAVLVSRLLTQRCLDVGEKWTENLHISKYSTLKFEYRVTCDSNYYGKGCEHHRPRNDHFGNYTYSSTGERVCLAGWTGENCSKPQCLPGCDEQHGLCNQPNECKCQLGWKGPLCNQCQRSSRCMHGTCVKPWDCLCNKGWGGLFCNQDLNFCTNHKPCRNGGTCFNIDQGNYVCSCPKGFKGTDCEIPMDHCFRNPCLNGGSCNLKGAYNVCVCPTGFTGLRCETSTKTCFEQPCKNSGTCTNVVTGYICTCRPGFSGADCEQQVSSCLPNPCQNGGTCVDKVKDFRCHCVPGYVGPLCQNRVNYCITKPCANGGTCLQLINDYKCKCAPGFTGKDCWEEVDKCQINPCQHGGTCVNRVHDFECLCALGFLGRECEEISSSAAPSARASSESNLTTEHVVIIATIFTAVVPLVVLVAAGL